MSGQSRKSGVTIAPPKILNGKFGAVAGGVTINQSAGKNIPVTIGVASTLVTAINEIGAGQIAFCSVTASVVPNQLLRMKITIDGIVVYDVTQSGLSAVGDGFVGIGGWSSSTQFEFDNMSFNSQFLVEVSSGSVGVGYVTVISTYFKK